MSDPGLLDRVAGALLGVHAGDSLGATLEFVPWAQVRRRYPDGLREIVGGGVLDWPAGHATDDTDLTRAVLLAYLETSSAGPSADVVAVAADRMLAWYDGDWPGGSGASRPSTSATPFCPLACSAELDWCERTPRTRPRLRSRACSR